MNTTKYLFLDGKKYTIYAGAAGVKTKSDYQVLFQKINLINGGGI